MADKVLKEFTYDGYGVVVEVAKRDDQGNNIAKTYVRQEVTDKLRSDLDAEIKRATEAESTLQDNIDTLTSKSVLDDEVETDDNNLIKEITIGGDKKKIIAERAINDEDGNNIVDTYSTIAASDETNAKLEQEIERAKAAESEITGNLNSEISRAKAAEAALKNDIDAETARATSAETLLTNNLNAEIERAKTAEGVLQTNIDSEVRNRESAINTVTTSLNNEIERSTNVDTQLTQDVSNLGDNLQKETDRASQAEENLHTELTTQIGLEREARTNADDALSDRIERLEGKTTRLYYGEGTLTSPTALEIQNFVTNLEVNPPYAPPYSGLAVVVYLTDEKTYHIWHYYTNLASWKDDGIDTVTTFTNTTKGIIQGSTNEGYISSDNGLGKVNGFSELKEQVGNNYEALNTKIEAETTRATGVEESLRNDLNTEVSRAKAAEEKLTTDLTAETNRATTKETEIEGNLNKEIQDRTSADTTLEGNITAEKTRAEAAEQELDEKITAETTRATEAEETLQANINAEKERATQAETTLTTNLNKEIQDRTNADTALKTNIENGTIVANKATNDSDGNPINTTYVKVEGFKTNYLDSNNVMYKDDVEVVDSLSKNNSVLKGLEIKGVKYNTPKVYPISGYSAGITARNSKGFSYINPPSYVEHSFIVAQEFSAYSFDESTKIQWKDSTFFGSDLLLSSRSNGTPYFSTVSASSILGFSFFDPVLGTADSPGYISSSILIGSKFSYNGDSISTSVFICPEESYSISKLYKSIVIAGRTSGKPGSSSEFNDCIYIGTGSYCPGEDGITIGHTVSVSSSRGVYIGTNISGENPTSQTYKTVIGTSANVCSASSDNIVLGHNTEELIGESSYGNRYLYMDSQSESANIVLRDTSKILFRNGDIDFNTTSLNDFSDRKTLQQYLNEKQDVLTAGEGISIVDNTISCTVTSPVTATDVVIDLK